MHPLWVTRTVLSETVSTDFDTADRLYFEPLTNEDAMNIINVEKPHNNAAFLLLWSFCYAQTSPLRQNTHFVARKIP